MRKFSRIIGIIMMCVMTLTLTAPTARCATWEFGTSGEGKNPFTPRGYLVDTEKGQHWLSSVYSNSGPVVRYTGVKNGIDYLDAKKSDGSNYTFYAMTDRNPWPDRTDWLAHGQKYLFAYKDGVRISNFNNYVQTPASRGDKVDPSGNGTCYVFKIEGFELEPGSLYEFGFLRGMQANNGITLVLAEDEEGNTTGYIQQDHAGLSQEEKSRYNSEKNKEYEFISSWHKKENGKGFTVNRVPMRFSVQTYADLEIWEKAAAKAEKFLNSVTNEDLKQGKYKKSNIKQLRLLLEDLNEKAEDEVKLELQRSADRMMKTMRGELEAMLEIAQSEKPEPADISKLQKRLKEAEQLYQKAETNIGTDIGQYGRIEVENLYEEIQRAKEMDKFTPQNEINDEVAALEEAIMETRASMVQEAQMIFYDKVTGIYVVAPAKSLPDDAKLFVRRMGKETDDYKSIEKNLSKEESAAIFYRVQFYQGDKQIQPNKKVEVQMPIADEISQKSSTVYAVGENGGLIPMESAKANGTQIFKTQTLEAFVLAGSEATEEEKAQARSDKMKAVMAQKKDKDADNKNNQLKEDKKKKEKYKDPLDKMLKRSANNATFSNDVRRETNPIYLIFAAAILGATAVALGIRGLLSGRGEAGALNWPAQMRRRDRKEKSA